MKSYPDFIVSPDEAIREMARKQRMYVDGICTDCGSQVDYRYEKQHTNWHKTFIHRSEVKDGFNMSAVAWCDMGDHAFKKNSPGAQSIDIMQRNESGAEERVTMDICGQHAFPAGNNNPTMRAVEASYTQAKRDEVPSDVHPYE